MALDIVDHMVQAGLNVSIESFHPIIHACEQSCDLQMVNFDSLLGMTSSGDDSLAVIITFCCHCCCCAFGCFCMAW